MSQAEPKYTFAVLDERNQSFAVEFRTADTAAKECFQSVWQRLAGAVEHQHKAAGSARPDWCGWEPWKWCLSTKPDAAGRDMVVGWCGPRMVGFLSLWQTHTSANAPHPPAVYVEHLAAFPGDIRTAVWNRHYRGVGLALLAYAVRRSIETGCAGRLGLHASNADALKFYRGADERVGGGLFHPERVGVLGPTPQAARGDAGRTYLETTEDGARTLLEGYRDA